MEAFYKTHEYLLAHTDAPVRRNLMDEINWDARLIGIKGTRGVGKTTFLIQYAQEYHRHDRSCLYININNFYFQGRSLVDFAADFVKHGGKTLLVDQVFKMVDWSEQLRQCYERFPKLKIVFTGSSVMRLKEENTVLNGIVTPYNLRGFSFREFLNLHTGRTFPCYSLDEILLRHEAIARSILSEVKPLDYFQDYLHHGFYPFFLEKRNFAENLLKTMNMMIEVDILLIQQIELKYLSKIKKLFYMLATKGTSAPNVSSLAKETDLSRATVMNYIKYLADARLVNLVYKPGDSFPKKPAKVMLHNPNLAFSIYPLMVSEEDVLESFLVNSLWKDHTVNKGEKEKTYVVDGRKQLNVCTDKLPSRMEQDTWYAVRKKELGHDHVVPLWLFGFLY